MVGPGWGSGIPFFAPEEFLRGATRGAVFDTFEDVLLVGFVQLGDFFDRGDFDWVFWGCGADQTRHGQGDEEKRE